MRSHKILNASGSQQTFFVGDMRVFLASLRSACPRFCHCSLVALRCITLVVVTMPIPKFAEGRKGAVLSAVLVTSVVGIAALLAIRRRQKKGETPRVVFVLGGPGSGKGTQCELIAKEDALGKYIALLTLSPM